MVGASGRSETGRHEFFAGRRPRIFAHRGLAIGAPENTLLAFLNAINAGATHLETDVHASADGLAVLSHDADLGRLVGRDVAIGHLTMAQLRRVDLGHGQGFVSLAEALDAFPDARFNIDVKERAAVSATVRAITNGRATRRVLIASFSEVCRSETVEALPGVATSASRARSLSAILAAKAGSAALTARRLAGLDALQLPVSFRGIQIVTGRVVRFVQAAGVEIHVWTVNDPDEMTRLLDLGVDGIVTDRTDLARPLIDARA